MKYVFGALPVLSTVSSYGQDALKYRFQLYDEEDGRIDVESHYLDYRLEGESTSFSLRLAVDSLSGETPVGSHLDGDPNAWRFQEIEDERRVVVTTIEEEVDEYTLSFEYARSIEDDYRSSAFTGKVSRQFNQKNTTLTAGIAYADDTVIATENTSNIVDRDKDTLDLSIGLSQILSRNTILDFNVGYGHSKGYLADPYRQISRFGDVIVDTKFDSILLKEQTEEFDENRPDELDRFVAKATLRHYVEPANAAIQASYRFFANSDSVEGHTAELKWIQQVNPRLSVTPYVRYYQQTKADYYYPTLTGTEIVGHDNNDGSGAHYSSDYRLSAFDSLAYGVRLAWDVRNDLTLDIQWERYEMDGRSSGTPDIFFPTANVISLGAQWRF
ncbi:DUF3570 domain-containing protein [Akkermansiaceae bacterium]|nr:DUF3570 domain-containing protein [Akkermansiaceae bacterium]